MARLIMSYLEYPEPHFSFVYLSLSCVVCPLLGTDRAAAVYVKPWQQMGTCHIAGNDFRIILHILLTSVCIVRCVIIMTHDFVLDSILSLASISHMLAD